MRSDYLPGHTLKTIYFGGGTPSLLDERQITLLTDGIHRCFQVSEDAEISIEANPGDIDAQKLHAWRTAGINRLSLGVQSFDDSMLHALGRRHDAQTARQAICMAQAAGFGNISIDLIYGIHGQSIGQWRSDIQQAIRTGTQHISAYNLSYEEGTQLMRQLQSGEIVPPDDECCNRMYDLLCDELLKAGMEHYEISNFARPGYRSQHNSGYWTGRAYLGIGPSAHSYDGSSRQWNISSLTDYCNAIEQKRLPCEHETLTRTDHINERIMLGLRTAEGISMQTFLSDFGPEAWSRLTANAAKHIERRLLHADDTHIRATREGIRLLNIITSDLMFE